MKRLLITLISVLFVACSITDKTGYEIDLQYLLLHEGSTISALAPDNFTVYDYDNKDFTATRNTIIIRNIKDYAVEYEIKFEKADPEFMLTPSVDTQNFKIRNNSCFKENSSLPLKITLKSREFCFIDVTVMPTATTTERDISGIILVDDNDGKIDEYSMKAKVLKTHKFSRLFSANEIADKVVFNDNHTINDRPIGLLINNELYDIKVSASYLAQTGIVIDGRTTCSYDYKTSQIYTNGMPCYIFFNYQPKVDINQKHVINIKAKMFNNNINYSLRMDGYLDKDPEIYTQFNNDYYRVSTQSFTDFIDGFSNPIDVLKKQATTINLSTILPKFINDKLMDFAISIDIEQNYIQPQIHIEESAFALLPNPDLDKQCMPIALTTNKILVRNLFKAENQCSLYVAFTPLFMLGAIQQVNPLTDIERKANTNAHCFQINYTKDGIVVKRDCPLIKLDEITGISSAEQYLNYHNIFFFHHLFKTSAKSVMMQASMASAPPAPLNSISPAKPNIMIDNYFVGYNLTNPNNKYARKKFTIIADDTRDRVLNARFPQGTYGWSMLPYYNGTDYTDSCITEGTEITELVSIPIDRGKACSMLIESNGNYSANSNIIPKLQPLVIFDNTLFSSEVIPTTTYLTEESMRDFDSRTSVYFFYFDILNNVVPTCKRIGDSDNRSCDTKFSATNVDAISDKSLAFLLTKDENIASYKLEFSDNFRRGFTIDQRTTCKKINYSTDNFSVNNSDESCYLIISFKPKEYNSSFNESFKLTYISPSGAVRYDDFLLSGLTSVPQN